MPEKNWALTELAFTKLLHWLDSDEQRAGEKYERLRQKLRTFFEHRQCTSPDELTDKTFDRVARKLESGTDIQGIEPSSYCYGVAQNILKEFWRTQSQNIVSLDTQSSRGDSLFNTVVDPAKLQDEQELEMDLRHLENCLKRLTEEDRFLILEYYKGDHRDRISNRHELSLQLDIPPGNLRVRVLRIREQLHDCINRCNNRGDRK